MSVHNTLLKESATDTLVRAELHDELAVGDLFDAEAEWASARIRLRQRLFSSSLPRRQYPESLHWDWSRKSEKIHPERLTALGDARLFGVAQGGQWQALAWAETCDGAGVEHQTRLEKHGRNLVYVAFVEVAPWNWDVPVGVAPPERLQTKRFRGIGFQLIECAVRWSMQMEFRGRIGLHALPQAERFYRSSCNMADLGPDQEYLGLRYFEMSEEQAEHFLRRSNR